MKIVRFQLNIPSVQLCLFKSNISVAPPCVPIKTAPSKQSNGLPGISSMYCMQITWQSTWIARKTLEPLQWNRQTMPPINSHSRPISNCIVFSIKGTGNSYTHVTFALKSLELRNIGQVWFVNVYLYIFGVNKNRKAAPNVHAAIFWPVLTLITVNFELFESHAYFVSCKIPPMMVLPSERK